MNDYFLVRTYENHAWGDNYRTLCIKSNGNVYKTNNKVEIFESMLSSIPVCKIRLDKIKNIEKEIITLIKKNNLNFTRSGGGFDIGTTKYYLCMNGNNIFLGQSGDDYLKNEYTNNIIKEIDNINNAVEKYIRNK
jgi:hypothetical protein